MQALFNTVKAMMGVGEEECVGRLRIRTSTLLPGHVYNSSLPLWGEATTVRACVGAWRGRGRCVCVCACVRACM